MDIVTFPIPPDIWHLRCQPPLSFNASAISALVLPAISVFKSTDPPDLTAAVPMLSGMFFEPIKNVERPNFGNFGWWNSNLCPEAPHGTELLWLLLWLQMNLSQQSDSSHSVAQDLGGWNHIFNSSNLSLACDFADCGRYSLLLLKKMTQRISTAPSKLRFKQFQTAEVMATNHDIFFQRSEKNILRFLTGFSCEKAIGQNSEILKRTHRPVAHNSCPMSNVGKQYNTAKKTFWLVQEYHIMTMNIIKPGDFEYFFSSTGVFVKLRSKWGSSFCNSQTMAK